MVVIDDDRAQQEQNQVVDVEHHLMPVAGRAGDKLRQGILHHEHERNEPPGVWEDIALVARRQRPHANTHNDQNEPQNHKRADSQPEHAAPVILVADVDVCPALEPAVDGNAEPE